MNEPPAKSAEGIYILRHERNFLYWLAWKEWLRDELRMTFFPMILNGLEPWPPETFKEAERTAKYYNDVRKRIKWGKAVPEHPKPWRKWPQDEMRAREMAELARRHAEGGYHPVQTYDLKYFEPRDGFYRASAADHARDAYDREQTDAWFKARYRSKLDEAEMQTRRTLIDELVRSTGMDREAARVKVMIERTKLLYPNAAQRAEKTAQAAPLVMTPELQEREKELAPIRAKILERHPEAPE